MTMTSVYTPHDWISTALNGKPIRTPQETAPKRREAISGMSFRCTPMTRTCAQKRKPHAINSEGRVWYQSQWRTIGEILEIQIYNRLRWRLRGRP